MSIKRLFYKLLPARVLITGAGRKLGPLDYLGLFQVNISIFADSALGKGDSISRVITSWVIQRNIRVREDELRHKEGAIVLWVPVKMAPLRVLRSVTNMSKPGP